MSLAGCAYGFDDEYSTTIREENKKLRAELAAALAACEAKDQYLNAVDQLGYVVAFRSALSIKPDASALKLNLV